MAEYPIQPLETHRKEEKNGTTPHKKLQQLLLARTFSNSVEIFQRGYDSKTGRQPKNSEWLQTNFSSELNRKIV